MGVIDEILKVLLCRNFSFLKWNRNLLEHYWCIDCDLNIEFKSLFVLRHLNVRNKELSVIGYSLKRFVSVILFVPHFFSDSWK